MFQQIQNLLSHHTGSITLTFLFLLLFIVIFIIYKLLLDPFGPNERCKRVSTLLTGNNVNYTFLSVDCNTPLPIIHELVRLKGYVIANRADGEMLARHYRSKLPDNSRILFFENKEVWAIDTLGSFSEDFNGEIRATRIHQLPYHLKSIEDCLVAVIPNVKQTPNQRSAILPTPS